MWLYSAQFFLGFLPITLFFYWMARWRGLWRTNLLGADGTSAIFAAISSLGSVRNSFSARSSSTMPSALLWRREPRFGLSRKIRLMLAVTADLPCVLQVFFLFD